MDKKTQTEPLVSFYDDWNMDDVVTIPGLRKWRYGPGGSITTNFPIRGVTQELDDRGTEHYGYRHFVCESAQIRSARVLATLLDSDFSEFEFWMKSKAYSV